MAPVVLYQNSTCPPGHYCPKRTTHAYEYPCPVGTYTNARGLKTDTQCSPCDGGYYCDELGQTASVKKCAPGTFVIFCTYLIRAIPLICHSKFDYPVLYTSWHSCIFLFLLEFIG